MSWFNGLCFVLRNETMEDRNWTEVFHEINVIVLFPRLIMIHDSWSALLRKELSHDALTKHVSHPNRMGLSALHI